MKLYRAMCKQELDRTLKFNSLDWNSKYKWFGSYEFVKSRVKDGNFNNSKFKTDRYACLLEITVDDSSLSYFKFNGKEYMLCVRDVPMVKILEFKVVDS